MLLGLINITPGFLLKPWCILQSSQPGGKQPSQSAWLSFGMDAALGCRANVFQVQHSTTSKRVSGASSGAGGNVNIHPQAAQLVCQHVMDTLIYLSKAFTNQFLPTHSVGGDISGKESAISSLVGCLQCWSN